MKKLLLVLTTALLITGFYSCNKVEPVDYTTQCHNGVTDYNIGETEVDCGGPCDSCPPAATLTGIMAGPTTGPLNFVGVAPKAQRLGPGIRLYATNSTGQQVLVAFYDLVPNGQPQIIGPSAFLRGDYFLYDAAAGDTGHVTLTAIDTVFHMVSGTFSFSGTRDRSTRHEFMSNGVFTNVRYK